MFAKATPSEILTPLLVAQWDADRPIQESLSAMLELVRQHAECKGLALYLRSAEADAHMPLELLCHSVDDAAQSVESGAHDDVFGGIDMEQADGVFPSRLRERPELQKLTVWPTYSPRFVSVPIRTQESLKGVLLAELSRQSKAKKSAAFFEAAAPLIGPLARTSVQMQSLQAALAEQERNRQAEQSALKGTLSVDHLCRTVIAQCVRTMGYECGLYAQRDAKGTTNCFTLRFAWNASEALQKPGLNLLGSLFDVEVLGDVPIVTACAPEVLARWGLVSVLAVPIGNHGQVQGVLALCSSTRPRTQTLHATSVVQAYAEQLRLLLEQRDRFHEFALAYCNTLQTAVHAIELSRPELRGHHARVAQLSVALGQHLKLSANELACLKQAAAFHDAGLLGGEDAVISTVLEFEHPDISAAMVSPMEQGDKIARLIREHHETFDGFGFPKSLQGDEVSEGGYVLACAEFVTEHTTASVVTPAMSLTEMAQRVEDEADARFPRKVALSAASLLRQWGAEPFKGGDCVQRKQCPQDLCSECEASRSPLPCWQIPEARRACARHGDPSCEGCLVWRTWGPASPHDSPPKPPPAPPKPIRR